MTARTLLLLAATTCAAACNLSERDDPRLVVSDDAGTHAADADSATEDSNPVPDAPEEAAPDAATDAAPDLDAAPPPDSLPDAPPDVEDAELDEGHAEEAGAEAPVDTDSGGDAGADGEPGTGADDGAEAGPDAPPDCEATDATLTLDTGSSGPPCPPAVWALRALDQPTAAVGDRPSVLRDGTGFVLVYSAPPPPAESAPRWLARFVGTALELLPGYGEVELLEGAGRSADPQFRQNGYGWWVTAFARPADPLAPVEVVQWSADWGARWTRTLPSSPGASATPAVDSDQDERPLAAWIAPGIGAEPDRLMLQWLTSAGALVGAPIAYAEGELTWVRIKHDGDAFGLAYGGPSGVRIDLLDEDDLRLRNRDDVELPTGHELLDVSAMDCDFTHQAVAFSSAAAGVLYLHLALLPPTGPARVAATPVGPHAPVTGSGPLALAWAREGGGWGLAWIQADCAVAEEGRLHFLRLDDELAVAEGPLVPFPEHAGPERLPALAYMAGYWGFAWVEREGAVERPWVGTRGCAE